MNQHRFHIRKEQILLFQNWLSGMRSRAPPNFTGHLRFWLQKYLEQNWQELFTRTKFTLLFLETIWSCHDESRKWKFEKIVTLFRGRMTEKNIYHTKYADWYRQSVAAYHSPFATLHWVGNKVALKVKASGVYIIDEIVHGCL